MSTAGAGGIAPLHKNANNQLLHSVPFIWRRNDFIILPITQAIGLMSSRAAAEKWGLASCCCCPLTAFLSKQEEHSFSQHTERIWQLLRPLVKLV